MLRHILATTALASFVVSGAFAQEATQPADAATTTVKVVPAAETASMGHLGSDMIGETVYNSTAENAENIGEVRDIVIDDTGKVASVIIGVGGFLGIGERDVALDFSQVQWVERNGDRWLVAPASKEQLEAMTPFDRTPYIVAAAPATNTDAMAPASDTAAPAADTAAMATAPAAETTTTVAPAATTTVAPAADAAAPAADTAAMAPAAEGAAPAADTAAMAPAADGTAPAADTAAMAPAAPAGDAAAPAADAMAPAAPAADANATASGTDTAAPATTAAIDRSTLTALNTGEIRTEELVGTTVYGADDANVGEIGDILLSADGKVDAYVVDVGGFLGMGEKEVAVAADNLSFMTDANGNRYLFTNFSKEQLEGQAAYDKDTYADTRDNQRLIYKQ